MNLNEILELLREQGLLLDSQGLAVLDRIAGKICVDNRDVAAGDVFVCIKGMQNDGHNYIEDARSRKAALVVCENEFTDSLPALRVSDSRKAAALLAQIHYQDPSSRFRLVGVTGTNGKTSVTNMLTDVLIEQGVRVTTNRIGSNLIEGISVALASAVTIWGKSRADIAVLELDERS
ncbi:MAG TPA: Mur ligase family protein, partial [Candidatus Syntrophosphaera sp.]|nr:Mur ligase family protein [Candidatus Syntrophosphaera sp.]